LGLSGPCQPACVHQAAHEAELRAALEKPEVRQRVVALGIDLDPQGEAVFASFVSSQIETWGRVVRENNIRPD
jgi:tripartite-type tricarboxylate transporter receptor subunit TctC